MTQRDLLDLLHHNYWANHRILDCAQQISPEQLLTPANFDHHSAFQTLLHMLDTEWGWRLVAQRVPANDMLWDVADLSDLEKVIAFWQQEAATMLAYVQGLDEQAINAEVEYGTAQGRAPQSVKLWQILAHITIHSTQHRSELARYFTTCGHSPGDLDFLDFVLLSTST